MDIEKYTTGGAIGGFHAYALGTESLNRGNEDVAWFGGSANHPVIAQNLYRWKTDLSRPGGRFEQIGMSWLKHGFTALAGTEFCTSCTFEGGHGSGNWLGMGCEDPYWAGLNGSQGLLGPRSEVNATSGLFPYPWTVAGTGDETLQKRMLVASSDLENTSNPGVRYFAEGQYIAADDAQAGNGFNNATFREVVVTGGSNLAFGGALGGYPGQHLQEAIRAWKRIDGEVRITRADYEENLLPARFNIAVKVLDLGDGYWHYEYAVHNLNSHRSGQAWIVPVPPGADVIGLGHHDIDHHSGEPFSTVEWNLLMLDPVTFESETYAENPNANALRWGTMFNFWFDADQPPGVGNATLRLFRAGGAGEPDELTVQTFVPGGAALFRDGFENGDLLFWSGAY
jgi:hypothetical protein